MPIILIWDLTVFPWLKQFGRWFDNMRRSCFLLDRWLEKRLKETEDVERLTSRFPVFRFYNEAVAAEIVSIQLGSLLTAPVMSIGAHLERALGQWDVPRRVKASIRSNQLLPELFRVLEELTAGILASVNRFTGPVKDIKGLFDPKTRTASDLFGLGALTFRAVGSSRDQIFKAAQQVHRAFYPPPKPVDLPGGAGTVPNPPSTLPMEFQLDAILRYVVAGLLVLPALGQLLGVIGNDLLLHLRFFLLGKLEEIERRSHAFRRQILDVFISGLQNYGEKAALFVLAARDVAIGYIQFYAKVGTEYLHGVVGGVTAFAKQLQTFWTGLVDVISKVIGYGNAVISVDIGTILHNGLVTVEDAIETIDTHLYEIGEEPDFYDAPDDPFPVTIGEMVLNEGAGVRANRELSEAIRLLRAAWNGAHPISRAVNAGLGPQADWHSHPAHDFRFAGDGQRAGAATCRRTDATDPHVRREHGPGSQREDHRAATRGRKHGDRKRDHWRRHRHRRHRQGRWHDAREYSDRIRQSGCQCGATGIAAAAAATVVGNRRAPEIAVQGPGQAEHRHRSRAGRRRLCAVAHSRRVRHDWGRPLGFRRPGAR